jgi:hypothetical protein
LLDGLRKPNVKAEIPVEDKGKFQQEPLFCLLEDDSLISKLSVETDRLLDPNLDKHHVLLVLRIKVKVTRPTMTFFALGL